MVVLYPSLLDLCITGFPFTEPNQLMRNLPRISKIPIKMYSHLVQLSYLSALLTPLNLPGKLMMTVTLHALYSYRWVLARLVGYPGRSLFLPYSSQTLLFTLTCLFFLYKSWFLAFFLLLCSLLLPCKEHMLTTWMPCSLFIICRTRFSIALFYFCFTLHYFIVNRLDTFL